MQWVKHGRVQGQDSHPETSKYTKHTSAHGPGLAGLGVVTALGPTDGAISVSLTYGGNKPKKMYLAHAQHFDNMLLP